MGFNDWLEEFLHWVRSLWGKDETTIEPISKEVKYLPGGHTRTIAFLFDENFEYCPGMVGTWCISDTTAQKDLVLICVNLAQSRQWLNQTRHGYGEFHSHRRSLETQAKVALRRQEHVGGTHLVLVAWIGKPLVKNDRGLFRTIECRDAIVCDLQGIKTWVSENKNALVICRACAKKAWSIEPTDLLSWQDIVYGDGTAKRSGVPWRSWLEAFARQVLGKLHVLQPPRVR